MSKPYRWGFAFVACGWSVLIATYLITHGRAYGERTMMGYSSGKGCFDGECGAKGSLAACVACCGSRCPQFSDECVDLCLAKWDPAGAYVDMGNAGIRVGSKDAKDYVAFCQSVVLLKELPKSKDPRIARLGRALAREAEEQSGLTIASAK